ncbi:MAG: hypothetical protein ACRDON_05840 [Gaiellaceae bacterium]
MSEDRRLAVVRGLAAADEQAAAALTELDELYTASEDVRLRALELEAFLERLPEVRTVRERAVAEAERVADEAEEAAARAGEELRDAESAGEGARLAAARRFDVRARDALGIAGRRLDAARTDRDGLEEEAASAEREASALGQRATRLAVARGEEPPGPGLPEIAAWDTRTRASLLVARAGLAREREGLVRQANEAAAAVLGEPLLSGSAEEAARRVENALAGS